LHHYYDAREDTECATYQHQLASTLARYPGAALVLASSTGAVERMVGSLTLEQRAELWKRRTTDFFRSIPKTVKVIIVEKSPQFAFDPVSCLARSAFWNTTPACGEDYPQRHWRRFNLAGSRQGLRRARSASGFFRR